MKHSLTFLLLAAFMGNLAGAEVYRARGTGDWDGRPPVNSDGVFQGKASSRYISMKTFKVLPGKEYTVSGEFRLLKDSKPGLFFFGVMPMNSAGKRIETQFYRKFAGFGLAEVAAPAAVGAREVTIKKTAKWETIKNLPVAFNAAADESDLPNFNTVVCRSVKVAGDNLVLTLAAPLKTAVAAGSKVRLHRFGASFLYTRGGGVRLSDKWQTISGKVTFDKGALRWAPGTAQARVVILPAGRDGVLEFRNITVTESDSVDGNAQAAPVKTPAAVQKTAAVDVGGTWKAVNAADWTGKVSMDADGVLKADPAGRYLTKSAIKVEPGKKYTLSGEFRLVGAAKKSAFYLGFMPLTEDGKRIEAHYYRKRAGLEMSEVAVAAASGAKEITVKKVPSWQSLKSGDNYLFALNAADNDSDLPNFNVVTGKVVNSGDKIVVKLVKPLNIALAAGSKVRIHAYGASFLYTSSAGGGLPENWQKFSGTIQFDKGAVRWAPGTVRAHVVILPVGRGGTLEFRNVTVTEDKADLAILRDGEVNMARRLAIIEVSDSGEKPQYRPGSMYDGKEQTAWITGAAQNDHDIEVHWYKSNVTLSGVFLDMTPVSYDYKKDYSYLSHLAGVIPESYRGKTTLPKEIKIEYKQYGKWQTIGNFPVTGNHFFCPFSRKLSDIQRLRLSFDTKNNERVAVREIQIAGTPGAGADTLRYVPSITSHGSFFIWVPEASKMVPHDKAITGHFRTPFTLAGKKPVEAILSAAAYNQAEFFLNGKKLYRTPLTVSESKPKISCFNVPVSLLKDQNVFAAVAHKTDMAGGMYGVIYQLAIRYADGTIQRVASSGQTTRCSLAPAANWDTQFGGFENWNKAHNRFGSHGYPGDFWSTDFSEPFFC